MMKMPKNELYHHGILGQRWGIRRFQNADGTLTPEGRARRELGVIGQLRYDQNGNLTAASQAAYDRAVNGTLSMEELGKIKNNYGSMYSNTATGLNAAANIAGTSTNLIDPERYKGELDTMSDEEIRQYVNRLQLENQYTRLRSDRDDYKMNKGREDVTNVLRIAGNVVLIAGSVAGTIMTIQMLESGALSPK